MESEPDEPASAPTRTGAIGSGERSTWQPTGDVNNPKWERKQRQKICCIRISTYVSSIPMSMSTITKFWDLKLWHSWSEDTAILNLQLEWLSLQPQSHSIVPIALSELNWAVVLTHWLALQCRSIRQNLIDQLLFWRIVALTPFLVLTFEGWSKLPGAIDIVSAL